MKLKHCPCGSQISYALCCGRYHKGNIHAPTAEALMRSRYSAYVLDNAQYVYRTWDEDTRPPLKILREDNSQLFNQLQIISTTKGDIDDDTGTVEFIASYKLENNDEIHQHHENSYFIKLKNHWLYVSELSKVDFDIESTN
ncbi:MAG: YchJ family metal-binding protein [Cocleimonas sp.]